MEKVLQENIKHELAEMISILNSKRVLPEPLQQRILGTN